MALYQREEVRAGGREGPREREESSVWREVCVMELREWKCKGRKQMCRTVKVLVMSLKESHVDWVKVVPSLSVFPAEYTSM